MVITLKTPEMMFVKALLLVLREWMFTAFQRSVTVAWNLTNHVKSPVEALKLREIIRLEKSSTETQKSRVKSWNRAWNLKSPVKSEITSEIMKSRVKSWNHWNHMWNQKSRRDFWKIEISYAILVRVGPLGVPNDRFYQCLLGQILENTHWLQRQAFTSLFKSRKLEIVIEIKRPTIIFHDYRQHIEHPTIVFLSVFWENSLRTHTGFLCWCMTKSFSVRRQAFTSLFNSRKLEIVISVSLPIYAKHVDCSMTSLTLLYN